jgi:hypothetical protein
LTTIALPDARDRHVVAIGIAAHATHLVRSIVDTLMPSRNDRCGKIARHITTKYICIKPPEDRVMKDQVHIRNAEAALLARALAQQTGKTISEVVLEALRQYRPGRRAPAPRRRIERWRRLLNEDRQRCAGKPETPLEALYDEVTGLPA